MNSDKFHSKMSGFTQNELPENFPVFGVFSSADSDKIVFPMGFSNWTIFLTLNFPDFEMRKLNIFEKYPEVPLA